MKPATKKPAKKTAKQAAAISTRLPAVDVEYDGAKGKRATKHFDDAHEARRFYAAADKKGKNPKVAAGALADEQPPETTAADERRLDAAWDAAAKADDAPPATDKPARRTRAKRFIEDDPKSVTVIKQKAAKPAGVDYGMTACYAAGMVIKSRGLAHGVTEDMVKEVGKILGRSNDRQDVFNLKNAFHAIRAFMGQPADGPAAGAK